MKLHCESFGSGPDLVLVHGWGWQGGVWTAMAQQLTSRFRVWIPDLPGHGASRGSAVPSTLDGWALAVMECVPASATWVGWSLGGLVSLAAAQALSAAKLVLLGTTPRFIQGVDWPCAWSVDEFERFRADVDRNAIDTLERFASLHLGSGPTQRPLLRTLRTELSARGMAEPHALKAGLQILGEIDYRDKLLDVGAPTLVVHGENDRIVFAEAGERMARALPRAGYKRIDNGGHALPLSHVEEVVTMIGEFAFE